jgi:DNA (cytosine-5)-methyltransferase 1
MKVLSLFSGVGGFDLGLEAAGMTTVAMCEWDKKAASVLRGHWPNIPIYGDVSELTGAQLIADGIYPDLVAFGSPCQDLSVAGKRAGLEGGRSGLFHEATRIIRELRALTNGALPRWSIWENVAGALSSNNGKDFGAVLAEMDDLGACFSEWALLDAQNYGVAQRRRRVFLVSCFDSRAAQSSPDPLLPVGKGGPRDIAPLRAAWKNTSGGVAACLRSGGDGGVPFVKAARAQSADGYETWKDGDVTPTLNSFDNAGDSRATVLMSYSDTVGTLTSSDGQKGHTNNQAVNSHVLQVYGIAGNIIGRQDHNGGNGQGFTEENGPMFTLTATDRVAVATPYAVRRLTPLECERLMGWPDNWTLYDAEGKEQTDGHRYKQCGNGIASPVAEWVGRQIFAADALR